MRMHADMEESRQKLQATRRRIQQKPSISSRLGERVDVEEDIPVSRRPVKERLGVRQHHTQSHREEWGGINGGEGYEDSEEEYIQSLLHDD